MKQLYFMEANGVHDRIIANTKDEAIEYFRFHYSRLKKFKMIWYNQKGDRQVSTYRNQ